MKDWALFKIRSIEIEFKYVIIPDLKFSGF